MIAEKGVSRLAAGKLRRLRRNRVLGGLAYWAAWAVAGLAFLLLLAEGIVGLASA
jgi:hypothetical protein